MPWHFILIELSIYAMFIATLWWAWKRGSHDVAIIGAGALFGLTVELLFVHLAGGYEYGRFLIMIFDAPLWVSLGWGVIIYAAHRTSGALSIRAWGRPMAAALMAVSLDFALDPIAEGLGWWHWKRASEFFGVSYDNFVGWLLIVGVFSAGVRLLVYWRKSERAWMPFAALVPAAGIVFGSKYVLEPLYDLSSEGLIFYIVHTAYVAAALVAGRHRIVWYRVVVPVYFHALFFVLLVSTGLAVEHPELYGVFAIVGSTSLLWFLDP